MGEMEYMKKKKIRAVIYCRVGNPADAGIAVEHTFGYDDGRETATLQDGTLIQRWNREIQDGERVLLPEREPD
mgnify:CR=1 FL=1